MTEDRDLACAELVELVTAYLDGSLDAETRARFDTHGGLAQPYQGREHQRWRIVQRRADSAT